jgi:Reverse transcriptase (RNA-dependent DNA polymerase)/gag-polypeptide of LTR copia-type/Integrase core domain/GAG-pre-integrase domain
MSTTSDEFRIPRLTSENYHTWSIRARAALVQKGCWEAIDPGFIDMTRDDNKNNNRALTFLFLVVEDNYLDDIGNCSRAKEAWEILKEIHSKYGLLHILQIMRDFFNVQMKPNEDTKSCLGRLMDLHRRLTSGGYGFNDREVAMVMLMGLPSSYEPLILNLEQDENDLSTMKVKTRLLVEEKRILRREEDKKSIQQGETKAFYTNSKMQHVNPRKPTADDRRRQGDSKENDHHTDSNNRRRVRCYCCGEWGHIARNCQGEGNNAKERSAQHVKKVAHRALSATDNVNYDPLVWYLDSAATEHMTPCRSKLHSFKECNSSIEVANGEKLQVLGIGCTELVLHNKNGGIGVQLKDILCAPQLDSNLISVGRLEEKGLEVRFKNGRAQVLEKNGDVILTAFRQGRLYKIEEAVPKAKFTKETSTLLWHRRLGHLHVEAVEKLIGFKSTKKISDQQEDILQNGNCETCILGKLRRKSFTTGEATRAKAPLELIHSDVVGKVSPTSKGGSSYFVTFIDDFTRHTTVFPMKKKSEVLSKFDEYRRMAENQLGRKVKAFRSDNGGEYTSNEFNAYLKSYGIQRQSTVPGTPQQNGVAERMNQTLMDMTRCLIIESGVTKTLWADALHTACHIRNKCPSKAIDEQVPETLWLGRESKLKHLRVYGCKVWSVANARKKLDAKSEECVLIGYPDGVKGYKLWNLKNDDIFVSRNVKFDEHSFPCKTPCTTTTQTANIACEEILFGIESEEDEPLCEEDGHSNAEREQDKAEDEERRNENVEDDGETSNNNPDDEGEINGNNPLLTSSRIVVETPIDVEIIPRRSERLVKKKTECKKCYVCNAVMQPNTEQDPSTVDEALSRPDAGKWEAAIQEELENLGRNETWILVPRPKGRRTVRCKWILKKKFDEDGHLNRYKARLVAQGHTQVEGIDYHETFSPVVKIKSIRVLLALAVERNWAVHQLDVTSAYLNGTLKEEVYMEQPSPWLKTGRQDQVCMLKKSIYGLHQSGREWNTKLDEFLKSTGLQRSKADPCIYFNEERDFIIGVYVDDLLMISKDEETIKRFKEEIGKTFKIKDLGRARHVLSMRVDRKEDGSITLDQTTYIREILNTFGMEDAKGASTPLDPGMKFNKATEHEVMTGDGAYQYRRAVGALLYLVGGTRPDLAYSVTYMSQFNDRPSKDHWTGVKHILRYVKQTENVGLTYKRTGIQMKAFCDADWASCKIDRRSFNGYVFILAGAAISWSSKKQKTTALSTVEAEYVAMSHATKEVLWMQSFLKEIGADCLSSTSQTVSADNQGAIALAKNNTTSERSKHIDLKHFFLRENVESGKLKFIYVQTDENLADMMTKTITPRKTTNHRSQIGLGEIT